MANNPYVNKVQLADGTSLIDISDTTATASDVANSKYIYMADGSKVQGSITSRSSSDLTASGATVTVPSGYYSAQASKAVASGTAGTPTATKVVDTDDASALITPSVTNTTGYITGGTKTGTSFYVTARELVSGHTLTCDEAGNWDVAELETFVVPSGTAGTPTATKGTVSNHSVSVTPSVTNSGGYITGGTKTGTAVTVSASELVSGTYTVDSSGTKDVTNYASASVPAGTAGTPSASKGAVSNHSVSVTPSVTNTSGYITGSTKTGTAVTVSASELVSGTYSVTSSGTKDVTNYASASVPSGTEGTPTATKGTVSNHSISVTPSVTNTGGYITGGTKTGTAVTVSASELVSGSQTVTINDTYDVTNLAELVVDVSGGSVTWVTEYDGNVTIVADSPNYAVINNWTPSHPTFADGQTWRVTWKGTEYVCPVKELSSQGSPVSYIGNGQIIGSTDTSNEPFFAYMRTPTQLAFVTTDSAGTITLKMELQQSSSATLIEKTITANGTYDAEDDDADGYSSVTVNVPSGSSKNVQVLQSTSRTNSSSLTKVLGDLTVSKTGTYDIYWSGGRSNTSSSYTWGTRLYVNGTGYGTENTSWTNNCQSNHLSNVSLTANQKLSVYTRGRGGSYYTFAPMLVIIEA